MGIIVTKNVTTTNLLAVAPDEVIPHLTISTWAGQSAVDFVRLGLEIDEYHDEVYLGEYFHVSTSDDRISFSLDNVTFGPHVEYGPMRLGRLGPTLWVRIDGPEYTTTEEGVVSAVTVGPWTFDVVTSCYPPDEGDDDTPPSAKYTGEKARQIAEKFNVLGEEVTIMQFDPVNYGADDPYFYGWTPGQVTYPYGDFWNSAVWRTKAFVGGRDILTDSVFKAAAVDMTFEDREQILLPATFPGFQPRIIPVRREFAQVTPDCMGYRITTWTCLRSNGQEYHLKNIRKQTYYKGEFMFYVADLAIIQTPTPQDPDSYWPWAIIYDASDKPAIYIRGREE